MGGVTALDGGCQRPIGKACCLQALSILRCTAFQCQPAKHTCHMQTAHVQRTAIHAKHLWAEDANSHMADDLD
jgi:porphobilinogen deaminase